MKLLLTACCLLLALGIAHSQNEKFNAFSIEAGPGALVPLSPNDNISRANYVGFNQFNLGARYMFSTSLGVKGSYHYNGFRSRQNSAEGIDYHRLTVEAVYNVGRLFKFPLRFYEKFGLLTHAGVGYARGIPVGANFSEQTGNLQWGLTPKFKISNSMAIYGDLTYVFNFKQHYAYDGSVLSSDFEDVTGGFTTVGIGIMFYFGEERRHADWY
mgnify:CR=1 FL=1